MTRILFVDDEQRVLDGLRRSAYALRTEWQAEFACGGAVALKILESQAFDVIVTDMRMPGIDGSALLQLVMERHPELLRIVLSGESESDALIRSVGVAHQYLSKPCSMEELKSTVNRTVALRRLLQDPSLRAVLSQIDTLPSLPPLYLEMVSLLDSPYTSLDQLGAVIARDMGMCVKVLQLANSAFFGRRQKVSSPAEAAGILGFNMIRSLSLAAHIFRADSPTGPPGFRLDALWQHSLEVSVLAEGIAKLIAPGDRDLRQQAQTAGLLHDVGRLVMARKLPLVYQAVQELRSSKCTELVDAEREVFGASHAELGAYILALWGLPDEVVEAVAFHHSPEHCQASDPKRPDSSVYAANVLAHANSDAEIQEAASAMAGLLPPLTAEALADLAHSEKEEPAHVA
jgi:putative nucleotidyltransferase with HDIG domain